MTAQQDSSRPSDPVFLTLEAWSQGMMVGSLITMALITAANMRGKVLLHKLVLVEVWPSVRLFLSSHAHYQMFKLVLAIPNGFFIFFEPPVFGWYLSSTATLLIISWSLHNVIAWIKNKPFLSRTTSRIYIGTVVLVQAYWVLEIYANFTYFNNINAHLFISTRPYEALCRYGSFWNQNCAYIQLTIHSFQWPMVDLHHN